MGPARRDGDLEAPMQIPWPQDDSEAPEDPDATPKATALEGEIVVPWLFEGDRDRRSEHSGTPYDEEIIASAIRAKIAGVPVSEIAAKLGCARQTVYRWCEDAGAHRRGGNPQAVAKARGEVVLELDTASHEAWKVVRSYPGTELALKALDRIGRNAVAKAALLGLNAPIVAQVDVHQVDDRDAELREMIAKAKAESHGLAEQVRKGFEQRQAAPATPADGGGSDA